MEENEPIPVGSETLDPVQVEVREDAPMLDVHPPHAAVHSWKDFWIHLATITIGLLIAVSLEQSVEWLHHLHQRHQLEEDLREEGIKNREMVDLDLRFFDYGMATTAARLREVESLLATRKKIAPPYPASSFELPTFNGTPLYIMPSAAVWTTAKESALIDLIPRQVARQYTRLYLQIDLLTGVEVSRRDRAREVEAYRCRFSDGTMPCVANLSQMTDEQLGEYAGLLTRFFTSFREEKQRILTFSPLNEVMLKGGDLDKDGADAISKALETHPDTFLRETPSAIGAKRTF